MIKKPSHFDELFSDCNFIFKIRQIGQIVRNQVNLTSYSIL